MNPSRALRRLESIHRRFGSVREDEKGRLVRALTSARLSTASQVLLLHEILCFLRAYPDDARLLADVERALASFARRADLARHRGVLADTGIDGTAIRYRFFWRMACWLADRYPGRLGFDRDEAEEYEGRLRATLPLLASWIEAESIRRSEASTWDLVDRLRNGEADAVWYVRNLRKVAGTDEVREALHDGVDAAFVLEPAQGGPSRTLARFESAPVAFRCAPFPRVRPDLRRELQVPPGDVRQATPREGGRLLDLAREAMVTRSRDLDAFTWGNPRDVTLVDDGGGLTFALIGMLPERRLPLPSVHGWLTLQNGVPAGYVQSDTLLGASEIAFNTFETFRGGEAGRVFGRVLAVSRHVLGARAFSIEPYQLGRGNAEGIASGAWWFYFKLGFRPKDAGVKRVLAVERARMRKNPAHRSDEAALEALASNHLYWEPDRSVPALLPRVPGLGLRLAPVGPEVSVKAAARLGVPSARGWERLAPVVVALPGLSRWSAAEKRSFADVLRSKGAPREIEFARRLDAHIKGARALAGLL